MKQPHYKHPDASRCLSALPSGFRFFRLPHAKGCLSFPAVFDGEFQLHPLRGAVRFLPGQCSPVCHPRADACTYPAQFLQSARRDSCRCLYTVAAFPTEQEILWDLSAILKYAGEHQLSCKPEAYAFYVFSIAQPDVILDYYEVYLPLEDS